ncbi:cysteine peptidase family C39 domain-containing protein [Calothrix sp. 336/3]|uniref:cysteine peptidase family C39 domain-containing protein n=1 Tax=Calothrix sp. 336/3 TaxID=1337936 RepID=UPI0004E39D86|nr:hypothetical protein IJ00_10755 [Calothrix sp. 336/3]
MKYYSVLQQSQKDCGAASLATVAKYYGRTFALKRVRDAADTGAQGTTLLGLRRGAELLGFHTRQVQATSEFLEKLDEVLLPTIIHWKCCHWVVFYGKKGNKYVISDPAVGIRYLTTKELIEGWSNGIMLLLLPDDSRFYEQLEVELIF